MLPGEFFDVFSLGQGPVITQDRTEGRRWLESGQTHQIDRALRQTRACQHTATMGEQRMHMARHDDVFGAGIVPDGNSDGDSPIIGRDAGRHSEPGFNRSAKHPPVSREVTMPKDRDAKLPQLVLNQRQANQAPAVGGHEVDTGRRGQLAGQAEVRRADALGVSLPGHAPT